MQPRNKVFLVFMAVLAGLVVIACSCTDFNFSFGGNEAVEGLAGTWQDPETGDEFVIAWEDSVYRVTSVTWEATTYDITEQSWTGSTLTWTYYIPETDVYLTYETISVSGDSLTTNWWNDSGSSGTETLDRVR